MDYEPISFETLEFPPRASIDLEVHEGDACYGKLRKPGQLLSHEDYNKLLDTDGRLVDEHTLRKAVFLGGIESSARREVWQFLFELYPFHSTYRERDVMLEDYKSKYGALKTKWEQAVSDVVVEHETDKLVSPHYLRDVVEEHVQPSVSSCTRGSQQQGAFLDFQAQLFAGRQEIDMSSLVASIRIIDKDVPRTDRDHDFFKGDNPNLKVLRNILVTYAAYHPAVGYAQGMNDIASRFLVVCSEEVPAYWCFEKYMHHVKSNFIEEGILNKLKYVKRLLSELDRDLEYYLKQLDMDELTFCHRWMLLSFKREFSWSEALRCFEILSSHHMELSCSEADQAIEAERRKHFETQGGKTRVEEAPTDLDLTFDVFVCVSILIFYRGDLFKCTDASEVFKFTLDLTNCLNLDQILQRAEILFHKYCSKSVSDCFQLVDVPSPSRMWSLPPLHS